mgnify:CR=1 FL=1
MSYMIKLDAGRLIFAPYDDESMIRAVGKIPTLRFLEGQTVKCHCESGEWRKGKIVKLMYREEDWNWFVRSVRVTHFFFIHSLTRLTGDARSPISVRPEVLIERGCL